MLSSWLFYDFFLFRTVGECWTVEWGEMSGDPLASENWFIHCCRSLSLCWAAAYIWFDWDFRVSEQCHVWRAEYIWQGWFKSTIYLWIQNCQWFVCVENFVFVWMIRVSSSYMLRWPLSLIPVIVVDKLDLISRFQPFISLPLISQIYLMFRNETHKRRREGNLFLFNLF